jgi:nucleoside-diphosphate-sugar epimerase
MVSTDPRQTDTMLQTNLDGGRNVLGVAAERGLDPIVHVSSFTALFRVGLDVLDADLPVSGGRDGYGRSKAALEAYARGLQDAGAPVTITYPGMVLGPPAGNQFGEAAEGVQAAVQIAGCPAAVPVGLSSTSAISLRYMLPCSSRAWVHAGTWQAVGEFRSRSWPP